MPARPYYVVVKPDGVPNKHYCTACRKVFPGGGLIRYKVGMFRGEGDPHYGYNCRACRDKIHKQFHPAPRDDVHFVWHKFMSKFMSRTTDGYRLNGYALMQAVERWAAKYPKDVFITGCDDGSHASSNLVVIEHRSAQMYMGATVVYIPQLSGTPTEFFLYPWAQQGLIETLGKLGKKCGRKERV